MSKLKIFFVILAVLILVVGFWLIFKPLFSQEKKTALPLKNLNETVQAPSQEVPQTNPFEEAETNPFKDIKTNPFDI